MQYRTSYIAENLGRYLSCMECAAQGKDFELILTVKTETRHPIKGPVGIEYPAICNHCRVMTEWETWKFCEHFCSFFWKMIPLKLSLLHGSHPPKICQVKPHIWLTPFQISSKSFHFRRSYCRMCEDRFCPIEYFQHTLSSKKVTPK